MSNLVASDSHTEYVSSSRVLPQMTASSQASVLPASSLRVIPIALLSLFFQCSSAPSPRPRNIWLQLRLWGCQERPLWAKSEAQGGPSGEPKTCPAVNWCFWECGGGPTQPSPPLGDLLGQQQVWWEERLILQEHQLSRVGRWFLSFGESLFWSQWSPLPLAYSNFRSKTKCLLLKS